MPAAGDTSKPKSGHDQHIATGPVLRIQLAPRGPRPARDPVDRIQWTTPAVAQTVDRVMVSPAQARNLLAAVRGLSGRGQHLEALYACHYPAALRPSETVTLGRVTCTCRRRDGGSALAASASRARHSLDRPRDRPAGTRGAATGVAAGPGTASRSC